VEMLLVLGLLSALALAAVGWGHDSRPTLRSKEWEQAALGVRWADGAGAAGRRVRADRAQPALDTLARARRLAAERRIRARPDVA
jgi:hypothetical protein